MAKIDIDQQRKTKQEVEAFLAPYTPEVRQIAMRLREIVFQVAPQALEQIDLPAKMLAYGLDQTYKGMICVIMPLKAGMNLGLPRGTDLPDPAGLLSGTGKRARHVKITEWQSVDVPALRALLGASLGQITS